jgi:hypothetical protein
VAEPLPHFSRQNPGYSRQNRHFSPPAPFGPTLGVPNETYRERVLANGQNTPQTIEQEAFLDE